MQPLYDPEAVRPMWEELAQCGVTPLRTVGEVDDAPLRANMLETLRPLKLVWKAEEDHE